MSEIAESRPLGIARIGLGTALVVALAAGVVTWALLVRNGEPGTAAAPAHAVAEQPRISTADGLSALAGLREGPVYWAGPRRGFVYEVTENGGGQVFIRYLPSGTSVGDPRPEFLTIATYPRADGFAEVEAAARRPGAVRIPIAGGLAVYDQASPTSIYLAFRGSTEQIEVYSPSATQARRLVDSGRVRPVP